MKQIHLIFLLGFLNICNGNIYSQINTDRVLIIGRNALYYEDYILSIQYFNQVIGAKSYLAEPYYYRAIAKYYLNDYKGAEDDCSLAIERNPYMTRAYQLRGETRQRQNLYSLALEDYDKVLRNNPRDLFSGLNSSIAFLELDETDKALDRANEVVSNSPGNPQAYMIRGSVSLAKGDTIDTFNDVNKAIELDKYLSRAYGMRGMLYYMREKNDSALIDMDHAIELDPNIYDYYINRGLVRYALNDFRGAMNDYDHVIEKESENLLAYFNRGLLRSQVGDNNNAIEDFNVVLASQPNNYMALYNRAILNNDVGNYKQAIADMDKIIEKYPDKISVYNARGTFYKNAGEQNSAIKDFKMASELEELALKDAQIQVDKDYKVKYKNENDADIDKFQLLVMSESKNVQESKYKNERRGNIQNQASTIDPEDMFVLSYYSKVDDYKNSIYFSKDIETLNNSNLLPMVLRLTNDEISLNNLQVNLHFESINNLSQRMVGDSQNPYLFFARAMDYILVQDYISAEVDLEKTLDLDKDFLLALFELAVVKTKQIELNRYNAEQEQQNKLLNVTTSFTSTPTSVTKPVQDLSAVSTNLKEKQRQDFEIIIKLYDRILNLNPDFAYAYYNRGLLRYEQGDYQSAIDDFTRAVSINNKLYESFFNRALAYFQIKKQEEGLSDMRKAGEGGIIEAYPILKRMTE